MKRIFIPFFAAAALLASCSDWTEAEHKDFLPPMNQNDPAFLTSLRDFKVGEHLVTMMIVRELRPLRTGRTSIRCPCPTVWITCS